MRRIIKLFAAALLVAVLMAAGTAPAFAVPPEKWGHKCHEPGETIGVHNDDNCGEHNGWAAGKNK